MSRNRLTKLQSETSDTNFQNTTGRDYKMISYAVPFREIRTPLWLQKIRLSKDTVHLWRKSILSEIYSELLAVPTPNRKNFITTHILRFLRAHPWTKLILSHNLRLKDFRRNLKNDFEYIITRYVYIPYLIISLKLY